MEMSGQGHAPAALPQGKEPGTIEQEAGWAREPVWTILKGVLSILQDFRNKPLQNFGPSLTQLLNPLNPELNPICYLLALLGAHHFLHGSRIRVKLLTLRRLMSYIYIYIYIYIYGAPILDVSRSHTTTQHSR